MLTIQEILRRRLQFGLISLIIGLIVYLIVLIHALGAGLLNAMSGAVEAWPADAIVYNAASNKSILRSELTAGDVARVAATPGVLSVARVGYLPVIVEAEGGSLTDATLFGVDGPALAGPDARAPGPGELMADKTFLSKSGLDVGDYVILRSALQRFDFTIAGEVDKGQFFVEPTLYASMDDWRALRYTGLTSPPDASLALVRAEGGRAGDVMAALNASGGLTALTKREAIDAIGGVRQQQLVVRTIEVFGFVIGALVIGIFFYVLTMQKTGQIAIFKAMGASNLYIFRQLVQQVLMVTIVGAAMGVPLATLTEMAIDGIVPVRLTLGAFVLAVGGILLTALAGSLFSGRHVVSVDPLTALGQAQ